MRKELFRMRREDAAALLARAPIIHLASTSDDGEPVVRALNGVVVRGALAFHGAPVGEKTETMGRPAVIVAEEIVASIPSYFLDPERACPATTLYRSAQVHGVVEAVSDPAHKAEVLGALMAKYQPEGGHVPLAADHPLYMKAISGLLVAQVSLERLDGKAKLAQNRTPDERRILCERLWQRGRDGDGAAIEAILEANPGTPLPAFLAAPVATTRLVCAPGARDAEGAAELVADLYWNKDIPFAALVRAHLGSTAWVVARGGDGQVCATARAISDGSKRAWIYDVAVAPGLRRGGLGGAVMRLLLDHPSLRSAGRVHLATRDAEAFYARLGFVDARSPAARRSFSSTEMVLGRGAGATPGRLAPANPHA